MPEFDERGPGHLGTSDTGRFFGNQGAGILLIAKGSGRILLTLRGPMVNEPNTWGIPGGALDKDEDPATAARREVTEELGYSGPIQIKPAYIFKTEDFQYHNFLGIVPEEFEPTLDWESSNADWFELNDLPSPLHFGVEGLLANSSKEIRGLTKAVQELRLFVRDMLRSLLD